MAVQERHLHETQHADHVDHHELGFWRKYIFSTDHKVIGIQYLLTSFLMAIVGAGLSLFIRLQLAGYNVTSPSQFNAYVTLHGTIMIFFVLTTALTGGFGNFLIPLQIGARDMAFPWLNMASFWLLPPAIIALMASFFVPGGPASSGWTAYPPLSVVTEATGSGMGQNLWLISIVLLMIAFLLGGINYVTTILNMRAPGLSMMRLPMSIWGLFVTSILGVLIFPVLLGAGLLLLLDRVGGTSFFVPAGLMIGGKLVDHTGGDPLLWQHLFWFFGHPEVYVLILPVMGMASEIIATNARRPIFGYRFMVASMLSISALGFLVWGHHMFTSGMHPLMGTAFMIGTVAIALPSAIKTFNWLATLWTGKIRFTTAMLFSIGFVSVFVSGGLSGLMLGSPAVDVYFQDSYFVVGHFHLVMGAASLFGVFAGIYHWFPKMFGRMMSERLGRWHFWITFVGIYAVFFPMQFAGVAGMMRRIYSTQMYRFLDSIEGLNVFISIAALVTAAAQLIFIANIVYSLIAGRKAEKNPWQATTLEWEAPSPPPHLNWGNRIPVVHRWAYDYSVPGAASDFIPQTVPLTETEEGGKRTSGAPAKDVS